MNYYHYFFLEQKNQHELFRKLVPNECIVYSEVLPYCMSQCPDSFDRERGEYSYGRAEAVINANGMIDYSQKRLVDLAKDVNMDVKTVRNAINGLKLKKIIDRGFILCPPGLLKMGFFSLQRADLLKGLQLVIYNYIRERQEHFGGSIDSMEYKIADVCHADTKVVKDAIHKLKGKELVIRTSTGRLKAI